MEIKVGCDLVHLPKFQEAAQKGGKRFLEKTFTSHELSHAASPESLAGIFAAKEAVIKALGLNIGDWQGVEIVKHPSTRPLARVFELKKYKVLTHDLSISHNGEYAFAVAVFCIDTM